LIYPGEHHLLGNRAGIAVKLPIRVKMFVGNRIGTI
jgi:hypothetical protein